jgi:hypothetical protein
LVHFNEQLKSLTDNLAKLPFGNENHESIKQLCLDKLNDILETVQTAIDESIYISYLNNQLSSGHRLKFCLGITSAENLINYYEKIKCTEPYMATEIKQQLSRHIPLNTSYVFSYNEVYKTEIAI